MVSWHGKQGVKTWFYFSQAFNVAYLHSVRQEEVSPFFLSSEWARSQAGTLARSSTQAVGQQRGVFVVVLVHPCSFSLEFNSLTCTIVVPWFEWCESEQSLKMWNIYQAAEIWASEVLELSWNGGTTEHLQNISLTLSCLIAAYTVQQHCQ